MLHVLLAAAIHAEQPALPAPQVQLYAKTIASESQKRHLDPWVFWALVRTESRFQSGVVHQEKNGDCSVGLTQIKVTNCDQARVAVLLDPVTNLRTSAVIQQKQREWCTVHACPNGWLYLYNPSKEYVRTVLRLAKETRRAHPEPDLDRKSVV